MPIQDPRRSNRPYGLARPCSSSWNWDARWSLPHGGGYDRGVGRVFAVPVAVLATLTPFHASTRPLSPHVKTQLKARGFWHKGCPVALSELRLLTVNYRDRHGHLRTGRLVVNQRAAAPLSVAFRRLFRLHFPIRHMTFADFYGPQSGRPRDGDVTASFECRQAVPSPCTGGKGTGTWSMHAYGLAVDVNPRENPSLQFGHGAANNGPVTTLFFTAGPDDEEDGLFGSITAG
ncbi:MAG: hypothetical protein E6G41_16185 [Actinobacteria bacterium]|nr:MAG: hypothetical protein E6G41_16185 [Actinomycetota bacterium]